MLDACELPPANHKFLENLRKCILEQRFTVRDLLITHAIPNHFGGAQSIVDIHRELGLPVPRINKKMDCN
jgi:glyoxylase-like metal-dependent hydrolase (beta-lactamase superfamily II)